MRANSKYVIALAASLALFPVGLDSMIVNVAIVPIGRALHTSVDIVQWIIIGYLLANAAVTPLSGYLGNRFGVKRLFLVGIALFTLFSFLCGIAADQTWLVAFRVLQGAGGGLMMPLGAAIALDQFAAEDRAKGMAAVALPVLLAPVLGPILGGVIIDNLSWQAIFFVNVPIGALAILLSWLVVPDDLAKAGKTRKSFDVLGLSLAMAGVVLVVYAFKLVSQTDPSTRTALQPAGSVYGWGYWLMWLLLGIGLALLAAFTLHVLREEDPVVDLRLFRDRNFSLSNLSQWVQASTTFGILFLIPVYLQQIRIPNLSPLQTGLALLPLGISTIVGMIVSTKLYRIAGVRALVVAGAGLTALGTLQLSKVSPTAAVSDLWPWLALVGFSVALLALPTQTLALQPLKGEALNKGTSLVVATKLLFGAIGPSVLVTVFEQQTVWHANRLAVAALAQRAGAVSAQAKAMLAAQAGTSALHDVLIVVTFTSLGIILVGLFLPGRQAAAEHVAIGQAGTPRGDIQAPARVTTA